jgi:hypothetical protein
MRALCSDFGRDHVPTNKPTARRVMELSRAASAEVHCSVTAGHEVPIGGGFELRRQQQIQNFSKEEKHSSCARVEIMA